jgi:hypothetical protein
MPQPSAMGKNAALRRKMDNLNVTSLNFGRFFAALGRLHLMLKSNCLRMIAPTR